jgi:ribonuclease HII
MASGGPLQEAIGELPSGHDVAGVDEAGRGPLAGPVVVAAVILGHDTELPGLDDSKRLTCERRATLDPLIRKRALAWCIKEVGVEEIDQLNILQATLEGMRRSIQGLPRTPQLVLVDGNRAPAVRHEVQTVVGGDHLSPCIAAASVLAKVHRDRLMTKYHQRYPGYGFARHKGYPTRDHLRRLRELGPCPLHRRSFAPVRELLAPGLFS